ncbi:cuticlin-1-like isoform X2 [Adelges cooleyi]|uniref:cuticlin-1-like isoform X2 n=1 Tax=Adelges cooleyi TaxID=133065 RepID=UPI00218030CF|nr:cuticlin-1-like isoform X2 [Adelges cooleyi]
MGKTTTARIEACLWILTISIMASGSVGAGDIWPLERPEGMPVIQSLEVMCGKDHMDVHLQFTQPFEGIVSSKGQYGDPRCVYVPPSTGKTFFTFRIAYARCGTKPDLNGQFYENTVVVQYDKDLLEVWDEAKRLRCEWYNDYEKTASKPPMVIADLDVIQLDFRGDNVDCWMEIQHGKGPWAPPVSGIVPLGSTLTLVVAINDFRGEFDMRVKSCAASDGGGHIIQLTDDQGCVLRPKMISGFLKARTSDERASVITYAFFHAFKFPDALSVHIRCKVEICRHGCMDHCQTDERSAGHLLQQQEQQQLYGQVDRKDQQTVSNEYTEQLQAAPVNTDQPSAQAQTGPFVGDQVPQATFQKEPPINRDGFPHGPRNLDEPSANIEQATDAMVSNDTEAGSDTQRRRRRRRRSVNVSDVGTADVGVSGLYDVISQSDLAFTPDTKTDAVTIFQGRIREDVVYGICMPVHGFGALFVMFAGSAIVSVIVAGFQLYKYQVRREKQKIMAVQQHMQQTHVTASSNSGGYLHSSLAGIMALNKLIASKSTTNTATTTTQARRNS